MSNELNQDLLNEHPKWDGQNVQDLDGLVVHDLDRQMRFKDVDYELKDLWIHTVPEDCREMVSIVTFENPTNSLDIREEMVQILAVDKHQNALVMIGEYMNYEDAEGYSAMVMPFDEAKTLLSERRQIAVQRISDELDRQHEGLITYIVVTRQSRESLVAATGSPQSEAVLAVDEMLSGLNGRLQELKGEAEQEIRASTASQGLVQETLEKMSSRFEAREASFAKVHTTEFQQIIGKSLEQPAKPHDIEEQIAATEAVEAGSREAAVPRAEQVTSNSHESKIEQALARKHNQFQSASLINERQQTVDALQKAQALQEARQQQPEKQQHYDHVMKM